ncbi:MAG TPA: hypothetical protein VK177_18795 [Flavobacteriales bacterium]|nr:hypothetical protein [Flavobacteriales bacterium]
MKTLKYSFKCDENPLKMASADQGVTRHCTTCERNIVDFTQMKAEEIAAFVTGNKKPCGFIHPSQIDEVNAYLKRTHVKPSPFSKWVKLAAIAASPFMFSNAYAQEKIETGQIVAVPTTGEERTEIRIVDQNGLPLAGLEMDVYSGDRKVDNMRTDETGKIYLNHKSMPNPMINLKNDMYGLNKRIRLSDASICLTWETELNATAINVNETELKFKFIYKDKHAKPIRNTEIEVTVYDTLYHVVTQTTVKTDSKGHATIRTSSFDKMATITYIVKTNDGEKWANSYFILKNEENVVEVNTQFREEVTAGIMVVDF